MRVIVTLAIETPNPLAESAKKEFGKLIGQLVSKQTDLHATALHVAPIIPRRLSPREQRHQQRRVG